MTITELIHQAASQLSGYFFLNQNDIAQQAQSSIEQLRQHSSFDSVGATITESLPRPVSHARLAPCIKYKKMPNKSIPMYYLITAVKPSL